MRQSVSLGKLNEQVSKPLLQPRRLSKMNMQELQKLKEDLLEKDSTITDSSVSNSDDDKKIVQDNQVPHATTEEGAVSEMVLYY